MIAALDPEQWQAHENGIRSFLVEGLERLDGVTVHVPLSGLNQVRVEGFDWQIPGHRAELVTALVKSLPKPD